MMKWQDVVIDSLSRPVSNVTILVRPTGITTATSVLYAASTGTTTASNPITADANGRFSFYAANGRYDLVITGAGINTTTQSDVMLEDVPLSNLSELSTAGDARTNLGLGSAAVVSTSTFLQTANNLSELTASAATVRSNIAVVGSTGSQSIHGGKRFDVVPLASTGQIVPDFSLSNNWSLAMTVNTTLAAGTNAVVGQQGQVVIWQNSTAKTLSYDSGFYKFAAGATATLSTATVTGTRDVLRYYIMDSTSAECEMRNLVS